MTMMMMMKLEVTPRKTINCMDKVIITISGMTQKENKMLIIVVMVIWFFVCCCCIFTQLIAFLSIIRWRDYIIFTYFCVGLINQNIVPNFIDF